MTSNYITEIKDYWIQAEALKITLNALGDANRIQCSVASGAVISCFVEHIDQTDSLGYTASHGYHQWPLVTSPTFFNTDTEKYVYVAVPRSSEVGTQALVVFPSEKLNIYGQNADGEQVGSEDFFYVWLQGVISAVYTEDMAQRRRYVANVQFGELGTAEGDNNKMLHTDWYSYSQVTQVVTLLKEIRMAATSWFHELRLGVNRHTLTDVATAATTDTYIDSDQLVATPNYLHNNYLNKKTEDAAAESIGFLKGLWVKAKELFGIDADGNARVKSLVADENILTNVLTAVRGFVGALQSPNFQQGDMNGTGWRITNADENGQSKMEVDNLLVRMRFIANILETRRYVSLGGNYVYSPASSVIEQVDYYDGNGNLLGYDTIKVPFLVRMIPLLANTKLFSRKRVIKRSGMVDMTDVASYRCWIKADDGTTKTVNTWQVGMLARCQTMDVSETEGGTHTDSRTGAQGNRLYWREVAAKGQGSLPIDDGLVHSYVDLSNTTGHFLSGSDAPLPGDSIVCYGATTAAYSNIIEIETIGADAPAFKEYRGVGLPASGSSLPTFSTDGKRKTMISPTTGNEFFAPRFVIETTNGDEELYNGHFVGHAVGFNDPATPANGDIKLKTFTAWSSSEVTHYVYNNGSWVSATDALGSYYISDADNHRYLCTSTGWKDIGLGEATKSFKLEVVGDVETAYAASTGMNYQQTGLFVRSSEQNISRINSIFGKNLILHSDTGEDWSGNVSNHVVDCDGADAAPPAMHLLHGMKYVFSAKQADNCTIRITFTDGTTSAWMSFLVSAMSFDSTLGRYYYVIDYMLDHYPNGADAVISLNYFGEDGVFFERVQFEAGQTPTEYAVTTIVEDIASFIEQTADQVRIGITNGLTNTGINIQTGEVEVEADKFTVVDSQGNQMLGMDADTDEFTVSGTIKADNFFHKARVFQVTNWDGHQNQFVKNAGVVELYTLFNDPPEDGDSSYVPIYKMKGDRFVISGTPSAQQMQILLPPPEYFLGFEVVITCSNMSPSVARFIFANASGYTMHNDGGYIYWNYEYETDPSRNAHFNEMMQPDSFTGGQGSILMWSRASGVTSYPSVTLVATDFGNGVYKWVAIQWQKETA